MTLNEPSQTDASEPPTGPLPRIVDRHDQKVGVQAEPSADLGDDVIEVELADELKRVLGADGDRVAVPAEWVAGVRRDEIRLSLSLEDPAFRSRLCGTAARSDG